MSRGTGEPQSIPAIHEASLGSDGSVIKGPILDEASAVARRADGGDVVVCGDDIEENRRLARRIEAALGRCKREPPHDRLGPLALPHFQPFARPPSGHCFYESEKRKARKPS